MVPLRTLPLTALTEPPANPNSMAPAHFALLVEGIRREGLNTAILARDLGDDRIEIIDGVHRIRAAREAGILEASVYVYPPGGCSDAQAAAMQIGFNRLRGDLDLTAVARTLAELDMVELDLAVLAGYQDMEAQALIDSLAQIDPMDLVALDQPVTEQPGEAGPAPVFDLVVKFQTRDELAAAKKVLRKAAGRGGSLARGLQALAGLLD